MKKFLQRFVMMGFMMVLLFAGVKVYGADITVDVSSYAGFINQYNAEYDPSIQQLTINLTDGFRFNRDLELNYWHAGNYFTLMGNNHTLNGDMGRGFIFNQARQLQFGLIYFVDIVIEEFNSGKYNYRIDGGAIFLSSGAWMKTNGNVSFINNSVQKNGVNTNDVFGGAIAVQVSTLSIDGGIVAFIGNSAENFGGAIAVWVPSNAPDNDIRAYSQMEILDSTVSFIENSANRGGAIDLQYRSEIRINNSVVDFTNNLASVGGAIAVQVSTLSIDGGIVAFIGNSAENFGGAIAVWVPSNAPDNDIRAYSQMEILDSTVSFIENSANRGGAIDLQYRSEIRINNSVVDFTNNLASVGGAIAVYKSTLSFNYHYGTSNISFVGNEAGGKGGAIYVGAHSYVYVYNTSMNFSGNIAKGDGGGAIFAENGYNNIQFSGSIVKFENNKSNNNGGAIFIGSTSYTPMSFKEGEVSFIGNNASNNGGAIFMGMGDINSIYDNRTVLLENAIFINNTAGSKGGAIYLSSFTKITIKAHDKDVIFSGNKANGQDNDIHLDYETTVFFDATEIGKKIEIHGGISGGVGASSITKIGAGTLILGGKYNLSTTELRVEAGDVKAIGQQLVFRIFNVDQNAKYSMQDDNAVQLTSAVVYANIGGTLELDVDFGSGQSDKLYASDIYFNFGSTISINGYGSGYENEIIIVFGNNINLGGLEETNILFGELDAIQYKASYIGTSSITVIARPTTSVDTPQTFIGEVSGSGGFNINLETNIVFNQPVVTIEKTGVISGAGSTMNGGGNALKIEKDMKIDNVIFENWSSIKLEEGFGLTLTEGSAIGNLKESKGTIVTIGHGVSEFREGIEYDGEVKVNGVLKAVATEVTISTLTVASNGKYSTADGKTHTTKVYKADISGTLEIGLNANGADLIIVSSAIVVDSESVWNITPFGKGIKVDGKEIALMITSGTVIGEVNDTLYKINNLTYQIFVVNKSPGGGLVVNPSDYDYSGIYLRIIDVLNELGIGVNTAFIANSIRLGALSNNGNVYANINNDVWVAGVVNGQNLKDSVNEDFKSNGYGVQAGAKIYLDENRTRTMTGGLFAGFNAKSLKEGEDKADANDIELGTYWGYKTQKVNVMGSLSGGFQSINAKNEEAKAKADFDTYSIRLGAEAEYLLGIWKPYIGIASGYVSSGKIEEKIDGKVKGTIDADSYLRLETIAGIKIEKEVGDTLLSAKAHLGYLAVGEKPEYKAEDVTIYGTKEDPLSAGVGIGVEYAVSKKVSIFLNGDTNFGNDLFGYYGNLGGRYKF